MSCRDVRKKRFFCWDSKGLVWRSPSELDPNWYPRWDSVGIVTRSMSQDAFVPKVEDGERSRANIHVGEDERVVGNKTLRTTIFCQAEQGKNRVPQIRGMG